MIKSAFSVKNSLSTSDTANLYIAPLADQTSMQNAKQNMQNYGGRNKTKSNFYTSDVLLFSAVVFYGVGYLRSD